MQIEIGGMTMGSVAKMVDFVPKSKSPNPQDHQPNEKGGLRPMFLRYEQLPDAELMLRVQTGNQEAAQVLVQRHLAWVVGLANQKLRSYAEAEEAAQDVFARVWQKAHQWDESKAQFSTWLYRIVVNRCVDLLRRRRETQSLDDAMEVADVRKGAEAELQESDKKQAIYRALQDLPLDQREALELVYLAEMPQAQAADALNISLVALESRLRRARQNLHNHLVSKRTELLSDF